MEAVQENFEVEALRQHLADIEYPASSGDLLAYVRAAGAPASVEEIVERFSPEDLFGDVNEVVERYFDLPVHNEMHLIMTKNLFFI